MSPGALDWYAHLDEALGSRPVAIYFYNFPQMTGINPPVSLIERLHGMWPERFADVTLTIHGQ